MTLIHTDCSSTVKESCRGTADLEFLDNKYHWFMFELTAIQPKDLMIVESVTITPKRPSSGERFCR